MTTNGIMVAKKERREKERKSEREKDRRIEELKNRIEEWKEKIFKQASKQASQMNECICSQEVY
ncbi:hypothetical protein BELL_0358g00130 [Botrytis elliptica]|uniref:Uncharacterized protein n=1 Tax=Botrytis elliptica TaxID=278938 RepID=A0A4Z1JIG3_9HELO|nr:hypothetical protein BELL_0358g00130 [Botrytis elliptica]